MTIRFDTLLALTDRVEQLVGDGLWQEASAAEAERQRLLAEYVEQSTVDRERLRALLERSRRTLELAEASRAAILDESAALRHRKTALRAYAALQATAPTGIGRS
jgi:hypothetical protein